MREAAVADAVCRHDPFREKSVYRGPQAAIYANYKNIFSADVAQSKAERIQNRPMQKEKGLLRKTRNSPF